MILYLIFSGISIGVFIGCGMDWYDSICYMFTTLSTGGFSTYNAGIGAFKNPTIEWATIIIMCIGGTNFFILFNIIRRQWKEVKRNTEVPIYYLLLLIFSALISLILILSPKSTLNITDSIRESIFQVVSIMTTTGFSTVNYQEWAGAGHIFLMTLMVIGGCSGSTSGGIKVTRLIVAVKISLLNIQKSFRPRLVRPIILNGQNLEQQSQEGIMNYLVLMALLCLIGLPILGFFEYKVSFEGNASALFACMFNIGPGFNEVGPTQTYAFYHSYTKFFLSLLMIMGRVELYAILALFIPALWKKFE